MIRFAHWRAFMPLTALLLCSACGGPKAPIAEADSTFTDDRVVTLSPQMALSAGLTYAEVTERAVGGTVEAAAKIEAPPDRLARIGSRVSGRVNEVHANVGDEVRSGATVALVDSPELSRAKADYFSTLAGARLARESADRERTLFQRRISAEREWRQAEAEAVKAASEKEAAENRLHSLGVSDAELAQLQNEGHYTSTVALTTPLSGVVIERNASVGQAVEPSDILITVVDLREVWIVMDVFEKDLGKVRAGQEATVTVPAYPSRAFKGRVSNVGVVLEPGTRAAKVRVVLLNAERLLKPGMFATVQLETSVIGAPRGLYVPAAAVQRDGVDSVVFIARDSVTFEARRITTGTVSRDWIEVREGLARGLRIVVGGAFVLKSEWRKGELGEGDEH